MFFQRNSTSSVGIWQLTRLTTAAIASVLIWLTMPKAALAQVPNQGGGITIRSDVQEANSETGVFTARGNVRVNYPSREIQATATQAQYYSRERRLVLSGNVYVIQQGNSMRAETMTYLIDEGKFIAAPRTNQQVESTYLVSDPNSTNDTNNQ